MKQRKNLTPNPTPNPNPNTLGLCPKPRTRRVAAVQGKTHPLPHYCERGREPYK